MGLFRRADPAELTRMKADVVALREAIDRRDGDREHTRRMDELAAQLAELDARVTAVSRELANQLTELGGELDALAREADGELQHAVGELRGGQVRLASEQVRYQIAFRDDLARLAATLQHPEPPTPLLSGATDSLRSIPPDRTRRASPR